MISLTFTSWRVGRRQIHHLTLGIVVACSVDISNNLLLFWVHNCVPVGNRSVTIILFSRVFWAKFWKKFVKRDKKYFKQTARIDFRLPGDAWTNYKPSSVRSGSSSSMRLASGLFAVWMSQKPFGVLSSLGGGPCVSTGGGSAFFRRTWKPLQRVGHRRMKASSAWVGP